MHDENEVGIEIKHLKKSKEIELKKW